MPAPDPPARREGLAGASVFHGVTGFCAGDPKARHPGRAPHLRDHGPCLVIIVDDERRLHSFLPRVADVLGETAAVATLDQVRIHGPDSAG
ncbi:hypothetical protein SAMN05216489_01920 [Streptomyces sp. 3213]|uniref:DUF190 domain-containing protein n=1 Tax=Streptomyces sp. 3213.3 TaxID=1855348 RepID=UPI00089471CC|nr:DUF190 domain-containing protein [Streptomyces sp. 3213.3]SEC90139.1 hypothetical protein SAMN05216489_01920 [Streptomyces sp. 3213] [Streptomyces sp. 3213.3]